MKISELPKEIKELALLRQEECINNDWCDKSSNNLEDAFEWSETKEGQDFWREWCDKEFVPSKADLYYIETLKEVMENGQWDENPRPKWSDGKPAHSKFISQKEFNYRIDKGEFPVVSFRPTAIKGAFYDIEAIYIKQTNIIEEMHPSIQSWWKPFVVGTLWNQNKNRREYLIGQTYGHTVKRYDLVNKLLKGMETNPFGRRHIINLWQEQQMMEDPKALVPCAYESLYTVSKDGDKYWVDMTLSQRSQDYLVTASINSIQYVMLGQMICGHLTQATGIKHELRNFKHLVQNLHIYDNHMFAIEEILQREPSQERFLMELSKNKNFYDYKFEDFLINNPFKPEPLSKPLEIAV